MTTFWGIIISTFGISIMQLILATAMPFIKTSPTNASVRWIVLGPSIPMDMDDPNLFLI